MEANEKLREQEAPLKNSDDAFVQVGHNGEPVMPQPSEKENEAPAQNDRTAKLDEK